MITKNIRTHTILLTDGSRINITKAQAELYEDELRMKKYTDFIKIHDIDTDEVLFNWRCNEIKKFIEKKQDTTLWEKVWVCEFGGRHPLSWQWFCKCQKDFGCYWFQFKDRLIELWFNVSYYSDINQEMKIRYKQKYFN